MVCGLMLGFGGQGDYKRAEGYLQRALAEAQQGFGPADPHVAAACQNLAELYRLQLKFDQAGPLYEKVLTSASGNPLCVYWQSVLRS